MVAPDNNSEGPSAVTALSDFDRLDRAVAQMKRNIATATKILEQMRSVETLDSATAHCDEDV